jgi:hypothetical protein
VIIKPIEEEVEEFKRQKLAAELALLTPEQQVKFHKIYPNIVPADRLNTAIDQVRRTLVKNQTGRDSLGSTIPDIKRSPT